MLTTDNHINDEPCSDNNDDKVVKILEKISEVGNLNKYEMPVVID